MLSLIERFWTFLSDNSFLIELIMSGILMFMVKRRNPSAVNSAANVIKSSNKELKKQLLAAFKQDLDIFCGEKSDDQLSPEESARCAAILAFRSAHKEVSHEVSDKK